jgi:GGDEF domain-containing protein
MAAPLVVDGQLWGEFYATRDVALEHFSAMDIAYAQALGPRSDARAGESQGTQRRVTAVVIDVNGLKEVNDNQGHDAGDQLLTAVARLLVRYFAPLVGSLLFRGSIRAVLAEPIA